MIKDILPGYFSKKKQTIIIVICIFLSCFFLYSNDKLHFSDGRLEELVRYKARRPKPGPLYAEDVLRLEELDAEGLGIASLEGIEALKNLRVLNLRNNRIECIEPLSELTKLEDLTVRNNRIQDISPLSELVQLTRLTFRENEVECIEPLSNLILLDDLSMHSNQVKDITPLENLTLLEELTLRNNRIADITVLAGLSNLKNVNLRDNRIEDFSPLSGLNNIQGSGSRLNLGGNHTTDFRAVKGYYDSIEDVDFIILPPVGEREVKLVINEFMASNGRAVPDEDGEYPPWLELYNAGNEPIDLTGWYLSDDADNPLRWHFSDTSNSTNPGAAVIQPAEYKVIFTSGKNKPPTNAREFDLKHGIIGWWLLNNDARDNSGNGYHGEMYNIEPATDRLKNEGGAVSFDGKESIIELPWGKEYALGQNLLTISMWVKPDVINDLSVIASFGTDIDDRRTFIANNWGEWSIAVKDMWPLDSRVPVQDKWTHLALVFCGEHVKFYIDGQTALETTYSPYSLLDDLILGAYGDRSYHYEGKVDDVRIYDRALSVYEVLSLTFYGNYHTNFRISRDGEPVILTAPDGDTVVDYIPAVVLKRNESYARIEDGGNEWKRFGGIPDLDYAGTTPGFSNKESVRRIDPPQFSHEPGFYEEEFDIEITHSNKDILLLYTLDGSTPHPDNIGGKTYYIKQDYPDGKLLPRTIESFEYFEPIVIRDRSSDPDDLKLIRTAPSYHFVPPVETVNKGTVIRARAFSENGMSKIVSRSYFIDEAGPERYSLPVLSLSADEQNLFCYDTGIYVPGVNFIDNIFDTGNYFQRGRDWERKANLQIFESDGSHVLSQDIGIRIHGGYNRRRSLKSFRVYAREKYGSSVINYPVFPEQPYKDYSRLILRNAGNDLYSAYFRDAFMQKMIEHLNVTTQAYRPAITFVNGEYWGILNIRERYDTHFLSRVYSLGIDEIDYLTLNAEVKAGSDQHYQEMIEYISTYGLEDDKHYQHIQTLIDLKNFTDYQILQIFIANTDWPQNNIDYWRKNTDTFIPDAPKGHDGRWRWLTYDLDYGFHRYDIHNTGYDSDTLSRAADPEREWQNIILRSLLENEHYRKFFIRRYCDLLNTTFDTDRVIGLINKFYLRIVPEFQEHTNCWGYSNIQSSQVKKMIRFAEKRPEFAKTHIKEFFNLMGTVLLTANISHQDHGHIRINTIELVPGRPGIESISYPWSGIYFRGIPIEVEAVPHPGYRFAGWEGVDSDEPELALELTCDIEITALFEENTNDPKVKVSDDHLRYEIYLVLGKELHEPLLHSELALLEELDLRNYAVRDLQDLQHAENLRELNLRDNGLTDEDLANLNLHLLEELPHLRYLNIRGNNVTYLGETSPIRHLTQLEFLSIRDNDIEDISALAYLVNLKDLNARNNKIFDISPLQHLDNLRERLYLEGNPLVRSDYLPIEAYVNDIESTDFYVHMNPDPHILSKGDYRFDYWSSEEPELSFPSNMVFQQSGQEDPALETEMARPYFLEPEDYHEDDEQYFGYPYRLTRRTRINGLYEEGAAFINTGRERDLGAVVLALDTRNIEEADISFTAGTVIPNDRIYAWRLQYRTGKDFTSTFEDITVNGEPVEYISSEEEGHETHFGPIAMPEEALGKEYVQLRWKYYHVDIAGGPRAQLRLDNIEVRISGDEEEEQEQLVTPGSNEMRSHIIRSTSGRTLSRNHIMGQMRRSLQRVQNMTVAEDGDAKQAVDYDAKVIDSIVPTMTAHGSYSSLVIKVKNTGIKTWHYEEPIYLSVLEGSGSIVLPEYQIVRLKKDVEPGETYTFYVEIEPEETGEYTIVWSMFGKEDKPFGEPYAVHIQVVESMLAIIMK